VRSRLRGAKRGKRRLAVGRGTDGQRLHQLERRVNDSAFGMDNAIDGQPNTEWSSNGDGDDAWIEIELTQA